MNLRNYGMYQSRQEMTYHGSQTSMFGKLYRIKNADRARDIMGMYSLCGTDEPRAPYGGEPEVYQRGSLVGARPPRAPSRSRRSSSPDASASAAPASEPPPPPLHRRSRRRLTPEPPHPKPTEGLPCEGPLYFHAAIFPTPSFWRRPEPGSESDSHSTSTHYCCIMGLVAVWSLWSTGFMRRRYDADDRRTVWRKV